MLKGEGVGDSSKLRRTLPVARRVLGENDETTIRMRWTYGQALNLASATLDDLREAVSTLEELERTARRVLGGAHPIMAGIEESMREAQARLRACETPEKLAQDAFRTARAKLAQERSELATMLADASARPSHGA